MLHSTQLQFDVLGYFSKAQCEACTSVPAWPIRVEAHREGYRLANLKFW